MRKTTRKGFIRKLDALVKELVFKRDGSICVTCGGEATDPGHLFTRRWYSTRWDLKNIYPQCRACNMRHEQDPYPLINYFIELWGRQALEDLHKLAKTPHKGPWKVWELEGLFEELKNK